MLMKSPIAEPSLKNLSYVLRHKELWPEGFTWYFNSCSTCAIGLCHKLYGMMPEEIEPKLVGKGFENKDDHYHLFVSTSDLVPFKLFGVIPFGSTREYNSNIQPEHVADRIDNWLAKN